jgi:uncharacterized protein YukE
MDNQDIAQIREAVTDINKQFTQYVIEITKNMADIKSDIRVLKENTDRDQKANNQHMEDLQKAVGVLSQDIEHLEQEFAALKRLNQKAIWIWGGVVSVGALIVNLLLDYFVKRL